MEHLEEEIKGLFSTLTAVRKAAVLATLQAELAEELARAAGMMTELRAMGFGVEPEAKSVTPDRRQSPTAKFRSRKDPSLTWSGRGSTAKWLLAEIAETGLDIEDFRV